MDNSGKEAMGTPATPTVGPRKAKRRRVQISTITWTMGLISGGEDTPLSHRESFHAARLDEWYTQHRIDRLAIPFLRRGGAGGEGAMKEDRACISSRTMQEFFAKIVRQTSVFYPIIQAPKRDGQTARYRWIIGERDYKALMDIYHRDQIDTVRRGARCFVTGSDGTKYASTLSQLTLLHEAWTMGIIYYLVMRREDITTRIREMRRNLRKLKAKRRSKRRVATNRKMSLCMVDVDDGVSPIFVDVDQYQILVDPPPLDVCSKVMEVAPKWMEATNFTIPGASVMTEEQKALAMQRIKEARTAIEVKRARVRPSASSVWDAYMARGHNTKMVTKPRAPMHVPRESAILQADSEAEESSDGEESSDEDEEEDADFMT